MGFDPVVEEKIKEAIRQGIKDEAERRRAITRLALIETALEARGGSLPRASSYYDRIVERLHALDDDPLKAPPPESPGCP